MLLTGAAVSAVVVGVIWITDGNAEKRAPNGRPMRIVPMVPSAVADPHEVQSHERPRAEFLPLASLPPEAVLLPPAAALP